jgi:hypothetical protein
MAQAFKACVTLGRLRIASIQPCVESAIVYLHVAKGTRHKKPLIELNR